MDRRRGHALAHVAVEFRALRVRRIRHVEQPGKGHELAEQFFDRLEADDGRMQPLSRIRRDGHFPELALVGFLKGTALGLRLCDVGGHFRRLEPGIKVSEVPFGEHAERDRRRSVRPGKFLTFKMTSAPLARRSWDPLVR